MPGFLDEYLVGLGFSLDTVGYARFAAMLRDAEHLVGGSYLGMAKAVIGFEAAAIGAFATLGAGILTFAEKTAMADQEYRLLALRMYTSLPVARELKIALEALGQPLENVIWDPELAHRFSQLVQDQKTMTRELGPDFENQMLRIRDVRFEFTRLGVELKYLSMLVVEDLAKAFGMTMGEAFEKLRHFNDYLIHNLPAISSWIVSDLKPVLLDVKDIMAELWEFTKQLVVDFTNLVALFTGNTALRTQTADFQKFAQALKTTVEEVAHVTLGILKFGTNMGLLLDAGIQLASGNTKAALADLYKMKPTGIDESTGPVGFGERLGKAIRDYFMGPGMSSIGGGNVQEMIIAQAAALGVPADLALAVAKTESGFRQYDAQGFPLMSNKPGSHATGIFQLQPGTARDMGIDEKTTSGNILGGVKYLKKMLEESRGDIEAALEHYYGSTDQAKNKAYAQRVMSVEAGLHIDNLNITIHGSADAHTVKNAVKDGITEADRQRVQRAISEFNSPAWGY